MPPCLNCGQNGQGFHNLLNTFFLSFLLLSLSLPPYLPLQTSRELLLRFVDGEVSYWTGPPVAPLYSPPPYLYITVVLEKTLESPLDYKEIQPVHSEGDQSWVFFGGNDAKAEAPVLWPPHAKS